MLTIDRERSVLLIVDFQQRLMPAIEDGAAAVANARRLVQAAEILHVPILFTEHNAGGLGPTVAELADFADGRLAHKITFDACRMAENEIALKGRQVGITDMRARQFPEAGVDTVDRRVLREDGVDRRRPGLDRGAAALVEQDRRAEIDRAPIGERHGAGAEEDARTHGASCLPLAGRPDSAGGRAGWGSGR